jgi:TonB family protein
MRKAARLVRYALLGLALSSMTPAAARRAAPSPIWRVGGMAAGDSCYASREYQGGALLMLVANAAYTGVALGDRTFALAEGGHYPLRWEFGASRQGLDSVAIRSAGRAGYAALVEPGFIADFARAASAHILREDGAPVASLSLRGSAAALRRLAACVTRLPVDPAAPMWAAPLPLYDAFRRGLPFPRRATVNLPSFFSDEDYPAGPLRAEEEGRALLRLEVRPDGRVSECVLIGSTGSKGLDAASCRLIRARARFVPALDDKGVAVADTAYASILWRLPDEDEPPLEPPSTFKLPGS